MMSYEFGKRLKELRLREGLLQKDLAEEFSVMQPTIARWETGVKEPNFETAIRIADFFKVSLDYLTGREGSVSHEYKIHNSFNNNNGKIDFKG